MHFAHQVCEYLNAHYLNRWLGRDGSIIWPAQLPNLNVLDYFVYNFTKNLVEYRRDGTEAREAILAAFNTIAGNGVSRDAQYYSKSRILFTKTKKALQTIITLKYESRLDLLEIPL